MPSPFFCPRSRRFAVAAACALLWWGGLRAGETKTLATVQRLEVGTYALELKVPHNWEPEINQQSGYVLFHYNDRPALTVTATLGLFRIVVPAEARSADRLQLASAYATHDLTGAQKALFGSNARMIPLSKKPKPFKEGQLFSFAESKDANGARAASTAFVRGWVYFPSSYPADGALFLLLGRQKSPTTEYRPKELDWAEDVVTAIRR